MVVLMAGMLVVVMVVMMVAMMADKRVERTDKKMAGKKVEVLVDDSVD